MGDYGPFACLCHGNVQLGTKQCCKTNHQKRTFSAPPHIQSCVSIFSEQLPREPLEGVLNSLQTDVGGECELRCQEGWTLKGNSRSKAFCNADGQWNVPSAYCGLVNQTPLQVRGFTSNNAKPASSDPLQKSPRITTTLTVLSSPKQ